MPIGDVTDPVAGVSDVVIEVAASGEYFFVCREAPWHATITSSDISQRGATISNDSEDNLPGASVDTGYRMSYRDVAMHKVMLQDVVRTDAYEQAINNVVLPQHRVLDFGCGTGVLAMFAARAGAQQVLAMDRSPIVSAAKDIAALNGLDNITFYHADHESLEVEEEVDVLVSEWMGHCLFYEAMLEPLLALRDRLLSRDGVMVPSAVSLHAGLVCDEDLLEDLSFLSTQPYGIDFSPIAHVPFQQTDLVALESDSILQHTAHLGTLEMRSVGKADSPRVFCGKVVPERATEIFALCGWFSATLSEGVVLGTGPADLPTHWDQIVFPLPEPFTVDPSREITITLSPLTEQVGREQYWSWSIADSKQRISVNEQDLQSSVFDLPVGRL